MSVTDRALTGSSQVPSPRSGSPVGTDDDAPPVTRRSKKKLLVVLVMLVSLLAAGGGGYVLLTGGEASAESAESAEAAAEPEPGAVVPLEAVTINLADGRYLQVSIALQEALPEEGAESEEGEELDGSRALDILIRTLSGRPMAELTTPEQREALKAQLVTEIGDAYHHEVYDIYFTSFVMQ